MIAIFNFLNRINLPKLRVRAEASGVLVIVILVLDLHRFGAWYTGNQCHVKPNAFAALFIAGLPLGIYCAGWVVQKIISKGWMMLLYMIRLYIYFLPLGLLNKFTIEHVFKDPIWYDDTVLRVADFDFFLGILTALALPAVYVFCLWIMGRVYGFVFGGKMSEPLIEADLNDGQ